MGWNGGYSLSVYTKYYRAIWTFYCVPLNFKTRTVLDLDTLHVFSQTKRFVLVLQNKDLEHIWKMQADLVRTTIQMISSGDWSWTEFTMVKSALCWTIQIVKRHAITCFAGLLEHNSLWNFHHKVLGVVSRSFTNQLNNTCQSTWIKVWRVWRTWNYFVNKSKQ
jgi:hypothetical protein